MTVSIAIVAHQTREALADALAETVDADALFIDDGTLGAEANHRAAWDWHARHTEAPAAPIFRGWSDRPLHAEAPPPDLATVLTDDTHRAHWAVVLEDDAVPVDGFRDQLGAALAVAPAPIVSLYLGTGHPVQWQPLIARALAARGDAHWLISEHLMHAVGVAIQTHLLPIHLDAGNRPIDEEITRWARKNGQKVAYSVPSLVDHADTEPVIQTRTDHAPRNHPRRAHLIGSRPTWASTTAVLA